MTPLTTRERLANWLARRRELRMQRKRIGWTWPRKRVSDDPIVQAVRKWKELPSFKNS